MKSEFFLELCFIRVKGSDDSFVDSVEGLLESLFSGKAYWNIEEKQKDQLEFVIVEVRGKDHWEIEEDILVYLEENAPSHFWEWLQGYRIQVDVKQHAECSHCGKSEIGVGIS